MLIVELSVNLIVGGKSMKKKTHFSRLVAGLTAFLLVLTPMPFGEIGISNGIGITASAEETTSDDQAVTDTNEGETTAAEEENSANDAASAEESSYGETVGGEEVIFVDSSVDIADSDELFSEYVDSVFYGYTNNEIHSNPRYGYQSLTTAEKEIYDGLKPSITKIANGEISSTVITVNSSLWEYSDQSFRNIHVALLTDLPYDFYWYNKTEGVGLSYSGTKYRFSFNVAEAYAGSAAYTTDTDKTAAASNAAANAQDVVDEYSKLSDYRKLSAYCDWLCEMVEYNHEAVNNDYPYGDPWQLIYAFDNDPSTKIVCEGYSKAYQYLYDLSTFNNSTIKCAIVTGTMNGGGHMWNIVSIDGVSYLVDVTNCDSGTISNGYLFLKGMISSSSSGFTAKFGSSQQIKYVYYSDTASQYSSDFLTLSTTDYEPPAEDIATCTVNLKNSNLTLKVNGDDVVGTSAEVKTSDNVEVCVKIKDILNKTLKVDASADLDHGYRSKGLSKDNTYFIYEIYLDKNEEEIEGESTLDIDIIESAWTEEELSRYVRLDIDEGINVHPFSFETEETVLEKTLSNGDYYPNNMPVSITADSKIFDGRYIGVNGVEVSGDVDSSGLFKSSEDVYLVGKGGAVEISFVSDGYSFSSDFSISAYVDGQTIANQCKLKNGTVVDIKFDIYSYIDHKLVINGETVEPTLESKYHKKFTYRYTVNGADVNIALEEEKWTEEERSKYVKLEIGQYINVTALGERTEHNTEDIDSVAAELFDGLYYPKGSYIDINISKEYGEGKKLTINGEAVDLKTDEFDNYYLVYKVETEKNVLTIEFEAAVTLIAGYVRLGFDSLADAIAYLNENGAFDATVIFNEDTTITSLAIPKNVSNFTLKNREGITVNFNMSTLTVSANTTLDIDTVSECAKPLTISVPAGRMLNIKNFICSSAAIKGTNTSSLFVKGYASVGSISTMYYVDADEGELSVNGNITGVSALNGSLYLSNPASSAVITKIEKASISLLESNGKIAKLTVSDVVDSLKVTVLTEKADNETGKNEMIPAVLTSGTTLLWAGSTKDFTDNIIITNQTASGQSLEAYLYGKEIKAEYGAAVTVNDGTKEKGYPNLDLALKSITDAGKSYTVTLNDYLTVTKLTLPKTAAKITFDGAGGLNLNMTTLSIPTNVSFLTAVYGTNAKPLALSVAAGKILEIGGKTVNIGAVKGTKTSELDVNRSSTFASVATFGKVVIADEKTLTVKDKVTAVTTLSGELALPNAKSTAAITAADTAALKLTDTNGAAPKVTIGEVKTKLVLNIVDENGDTIGLINSRPVLYANGKNLALNKIEIANTSAVFDNALKPFLYGKEIRAENENAIKLDDGTTEKYYPNLDLAFGAITDPQKGYAIYLNENIAVSKLTLPKKAAFIGFAGPGSLDLNMTALSIPVNTELSANLNGTNAKPLAISVAAGKTLSISKEVANVGTVKGTKTSSLYVNTAVTVGSVSTFGNIVAVGGSSDGVLNVTGNVSAVTKLKGTLMLSGIRSTAAITDAENATLKLVDVNGLSAKATVTSVSGEKLKVVFVDENGDEIGIGAGKSVLWMGGKNDIRDDITLVNKAKYESELELKLYGKEIRADIAQAVQVYDGNESVYYEGLENAFAAISKVKTPKDYTITLNENVSAAKLTIPKTASSITFKGNGSINLNMTSLAIPTDVTFLVPVNGTNIKPLAISVAAGKDLVFGYSSAVSNIGVVKGAKNASFNNSTEMTVGGLASFGYVNAEEVLSVSGNISGISYFSGKLEMTNAKSTASGMIIEEGAEITLVQTNGVIPKMTVAEFRGNETAKITIVDEEGEAVKLPSGKTVLYSSSKFDYSAAFEIKNPSAAGSDKLKSKLVGKEIKAVNGSAVTLMADKTSVGSFATLEEAIAKINALNKPTAHYDITLNDDVYVAKLTMPTKAASLTIDGTNFTMWLNNITSIAANSDFMLKNVTVKNTKTYTITAKKSLTLDNVVSDCLSAIKGTSKFEYREYNSDLTFTGKNGVEQTKVTGFKSIVRS